MKNIFFSILSYSATLLHAAVVDAVIVVAVALAFIIFLAIIKIM